MLSFSGFMSSCFNTKTDLMEDTMEKKPLITTSVYFGNKEALFDLYISPLARDAHRHTEARWVVCAAFNATCSHCRSATSHPRKFYLPVISANRNISFPLFLLVSVHQHALTLPFAQASHCRPIKCLYVPVTIIILMFSFKIQ